MSARAYSSRGKAMSEGLLALWQGVFPETGPVRVHDGPSLSASSASQIVVVGWPGFMPGYQTPRTALNEQLGTAAIMTENTLEGLGPSQLQKITVNCAMLCRPGERSDMPRARTEAYANYNACAVAVFADTTLAGRFGRGAIRLVIGAAEDTHQVLDHRGTLCLVTFSIVGHTYALQ